MLSVPSNHFPVRPPWPATLFVACMVAVVASLSGEASVARAQATAPEKAAAEGLFDDGLKLMKAGKYQEACEKLRQSQAVEAGIGTLLYLGECYAKTGRTASAWASYREAASAAQAQGQTARARAGTARADELEPQLSRLVIKTGPENLGIEGFAVTFGSTRLSSGLLGTAFPVDPGEHSLSASAPGYETWTGSATVATAATTVEVVVPALVAAPEPVAADTPPKTDGEGVAPGTAGSAAMTASSDTDGLSDMKIAGLIVGGVGVVALGLGTYFGVSAISDENRLADICSDEMNLTADGQCVGDAALTTEDDRDQAATLANVFVIGGLAAAVGGAVLYFLVPGGEDEPPAVSLAADVAPDGRGGALWLTGKF